VNRIKIPARADLRVLVAEDDELNRLLIGKILEKSKISHRVVSNGLEALEAFKEENYHVVFLDMNMPVMDGPEAATRIRSLTSQSRMPPLIVALSGMKPEEVLAREEIFDYALEKPFTRDQLLGILDSEERVIEPEKQREVFSPGDRQRVWEKIDEHPEFYRELLVQFDLSVKEHLGHLKTFLSAGNAREALRIAHILKGEFAIFSASRAREHLEHLENLLLKGDFETAGGVVTAIEGVHEEMTAIVADYIQAKCES